MGHLMENMLADGTDVHGGVDATDKQIKALKKDIKILEQQKELAERRRARLERQKAGKSLAKETRRCQKLAMGKIEKQRQGYEKKKEEKGKTYSLVNGVSSSDMLG